MFNPNQYCIIHKASGQNDIYGMPLPGRRVRSAFAVVKLNVRSEKSSVRADTTASRGNAIELEVDAEFLFSKTTSLSIDDVIEYAGSKFRVVSKFPQHNLQGALDHYQVSCSYWSAE